MNNLYRIFVVLFLTVLSVSCSEEQKEAKDVLPDTTEKIKSEKILKIDSLKEKQSDTIAKSEKKQKKEVKTYKFICPLGCKKGNSDIKGTCPECGMELIENPDYITKNKNKKK